MMKNLLLNELTETFERLSTTYDNLLSTAKTKHDFLLSGNMEGLETILYQEKNQTEIAQLLEEKRQNVLFRYCKENNIKDNRITMKSLLNNIDDMSRAKIEAILDGLTLVVKELQDANARNATLTNYSLEVTEDIIRIFCPPAFQHQTYCNTGKKNENKLPMVLIDTKV